MRTKAEILRARMADLKNVRALQLALEHAKTCPDTWHFSDPGDKAVCWYPLMGGIDIDPAHYRAKRARAA